MNFKVLTLLGVLFFVATSVAESKSAGEKKGIDREAVRRAIRSSLSEVKKCYENRLPNNPSLGGKIVVRFVIKDDGSVSKSEIKSTTVNDSQVEGCVTNVIAQKTYPAPPKGEVAEINYPFVFESKK